jgi:hypothetical protein
MAIASSVRQYTKADNPEATTGPIDITGAVDDKNRLIIRAEAIEAGIVLNTRATESSEKVGAFLQA